MARKHEIKLQVNDLTFTATSSWEQSLVGVKKPGKLILLLHGFPDNRSTWDAVWPAFTKAFGPSTLLVAPAMRGYEPSSQTGDDYTYFQKDLASDIVGFIKQLTLNDQSVPAHLVGHDWGAIASFKTVSLYPEWVTSYVALAIPYLANVRPWQFAVQFPRQLWLSSYFITLQLPFVYRPRLSQRHNANADYRSYIQDLWEAWSPGWKFTEAELSAVEDTFQQPGVADAASAYYRCLFRNLPAADWVVDFDKTPALILGGETDGCIMADLFRYEARQLGDSKVVLLPTVGHFLQREAPDEVSRRVIDFLNQ